MEGFGKKIALPEALADEFIPSYSGFVSTQSEDDTSTELDDTSDISSCNETIKEPRAHQVEQHKGFKYLENEFQTIKRSISSVLSAQKDEQQSLVTQLTGKLITNPVFSKVTKFYNLNSHLIDPVYFLKMVLELGEFPTEAKTQSWIWIFTGITMEKQLTS